MNPTSPQRPSTPPSPTSRPPQAAADLPHPSRGRCHGDDTEHPSWRATRSAAGNGTPLSQRSAGTPGSTPSLPEPDFPAMRRTLVAFVQRESAPGDLATFRNGLASMLAGLLAAINHDPALREVPDTRRRHAVQGLGMAFEAYARLSPPQRDALTDILWDQLQDIAGWSGTTRLAVLDELTRLHAVLPGAFVLRMIDRIIQNSEPGPERPLLLEIMERLSGQCDPDTPDATLKHALSAARARRLARAKAQEQAQQAVAHDTKATSQSTQASTDTAIIDGLLRALEGLPNATAAHKRARRRALRAGMRELETRPGAATRTEWITALYRRITDPTLAISDALRQQAYVELFRRDWPSQEAALKSVTAHRARVEAFASCLDEVEWIPVKQAARQLKDGKAQSAS